MTGRYLGHLSQSDPLYGYIQGSIAPQMGFTSPGAIYRVFKFTASQSVYLYEERQGRIRIVVKSHEQHHPGSPFPIRNTGEKEYSDLLYLRGRGFTSAPHYVVKPLGYNAGIGNALLTEYLEGDPLCAVINGELKHFFFRSTGDPHAAEPFIGHFLWEYCSHFPDRVSAFRAVTRRTPFHMGITLLRIARNSWIDCEYRWRLVGEAKAILRAAL